MGGPRRGTRLWPQRMEAPPAVRCMRCSCSARAQVDRVGVRPCNPMPSISRGAPAQPHLCAKGRLHDSLSLCMHRSWSAGLRANASVARWSSRCGKAPLLPCTFLVRTACMCFVTEHVGLLAWPVTLYRFRSCAVLALYLLHAMQRQGVGFCRDCRHLSTLQLQC